ncbi:MAG: hypothetical protein HQL87_18250 [Magnetococcales bacterium]|nr:hypothetical protein [Magnetococcales bacterium]
MSADIVASVAQYQFRDRLRMLLRTENAQRQIAYMVQKAAESRLPAGAEGEALLEAARVRLATAKGITLPVVEADTGGSDATSAGGQSAAS